MQVAGVVGKAEVSRRTADVDMSSKKSTRCSQDSCILGLPNNDMAMCNSHITGCET